MDKFVDALTHIFDWIKKRFFYFDGFLVTIILCWVFLDFGISVVGPSGHKTIEHVLGHYEESSYAVANFSSYAVTTVIIAIIWFRLRRIPRFATDQAGVFFLSDCLPEQQAELIRLRERVHSELKAKDLLNFINVKVLPPNIRIHDVQEASSILKKSFATLIVWGPFEKATHDGERVSGFPKLNFTYSHPANVSKDFHMQVATSLVGRKWMFQESNEVIEKSLVIDNISQVAINIIGMALLVKGYFQKAEAILGVLDVELDGVRRKPHLPVEFANFCANVRKNRLRASGLQLKIEYMEVFRGQGIFHASSHELGRWRVRIDEAVKLDKRDSGFFVMQAIVTFLQQNMEESRRAISKAIECAPIADPSPDFCLAFVALFENQFRKARSSYKKALAKKGSYNNELIAEIVEFIGQALDKYPSKFQFHYALGLLNEQRLDRSVALGQYRAFIERARNDTYYSSFVKEVEQRIAKLI
jgi:tetratricopeptide (TPR) repeat protein